MSNTHLENSTAKAVSDIGETYTNLKEQNDNLGNNPENREYLINGRQIRELTIILSYLCDKFAIPAIRELNSLDQVDDYMLTETPKVE